MKLISALYPTLLLYFLSIPFVQAQGAQCAPYPGGICSGYVDYNVYLPTGVTFETIEQKLQPLLNLTEQLSEIHYGCVEAHHQYSCSFYYPKCTNTVKNGTETLSFQMGCLSACENAKDECGVIFTVTGSHDRSPNCTAASPFTDLPPQSSNCNLVPAKDPEKASHGLNISAVPAGYILTECTPPFIKDPLAKVGTNDTADPLYCRFGCCTPCPAQNYFYKEGYTEKGFLATDVIRMTGCVLSLFVLISYLVLPDKRTNPGATIILFISLCIFVFSLVSFFSIGNPKRIQCAPDGIQQGAQDNNTLCAVQGALLIFASMGSTMWCGVMIFNLHLHTVWNNNFLHDKYIILNIVCWGVPAAITGVVLGLHAVKFEFANLCLVEVDLIMKAFFYPLAAVALPSFIAHVATFFYIGKIAMKTGIEQEMSQSLSSSAGGDSTLTPGQAMSRGRHRHVITAVKIQWRALWLVTVMVIAVVFYWLFYMINMGKMVELKYDPEAIYGWIGCMMDPKTTQNDCTVYLEEYLPPFPLMITAEALVSIIGISLFLNFFKLSLLQEWKGLFYNIRASIGMRRHVEKNGDQFYAL